MEKVEEALADGRRTGARSSFVRVVVEVLRGRRSWRIGCRRGSRPRRLRLLSQTLSPKWMCKWPRVGSMRLVEAAVALQRRRCRIKGLGV